MTHPLLQAVELIEAQIATLNTNKSTCECCGLTKYENFPEFQQHIELTAAVNKIRRRILKE